MQIDEFKKIIALAVTAEVEAYEFYTAAAAKMKDPTLRSIFQELAAEEQQHQELLEKLTIEVQPASLAPVGDYRIAESVARPRLSVSMQPAEAIALAMKNEQEAMWMYTELAKVSADPGQRAMFESLARMEQGHKVKLEGLYTDMAYVEAW